MSEDLLESGIEAYRQGNRALASSFFARIILENPSQAAAWNWLSRCLDDFEKADYCFRRALALDPAVSINEHAVIQKNQPANVQPFTTSLPEVPENTWGESSYSADGQGED